MRRPCGATPSTVTAKGMTMSSKFTLLAAVVGFALGLGAGWAIFADDGSPCWKVQASLEDARDDVFATAGKEGYDVLRRTAAEHPNCFSPEDREFFRQMAEAPQHPLPGDGGEATAEATESSTPEG